MSASGCFGRNFGTKKLELIINAYPNIMKNDWTKTEFLNSVEQIDGIGSTLALQFVTNFKKFITFYKELNEIIDLKYLEKKKVIKQSTGIFQGKKIVFTGFRDQTLEQYIIDKGGIISNNITKDTYLLVCKDKTISSEKITSPFQMKGALIQHALPLIFQDCSCRN